MDSLVNASSLFPEFIMPSKSIDYDAIVVGAGFGGIRSMWELGQLGLTYKCFEAGTDVGGAWYWNRYPGARTDSEAWVYNMNFLPDMGMEWDYSERYPSQGEVQYHLGKVVGSSVPLRPAFAMLLSALRCVPTTNR